MGLNKIVDFSIAKLLKEKIFPQPKTTFEAQQLGMEFNWYNEDGVRNANYKLDSAIQAPTIAEVVMWLYEKHGIWITVGVDSLFYKGKHNVLIYKNIGYGLELSSIENNLHGPYNSPTEAYEAAILYILKNLIP